MGAWITRGAIWLALTLYVGGQLLSLREGMFSRFRWWHTLGGAAFLVHIVGAFQFYHAWSHRLAYDETARQTEALFGWRWGGGLFINYVLALVWMGDVAWAWLKSASYVRRGSVITWVLRFFFLFMIFNGAFVFAPAPGRWYGLLLCLSLLAGWVRKEVRARRLNHGVPIS